MQAGDSHTCQQFDEVCAERDALEAELAEAKEGLKPSHLGEPTWHQGYRHVDGQIIAVTEGLICKGDYDYLQQALAKAKVERDALADELEYIAVQCDRKSVGKILEERTEDRAAIRAAHDKLVATYKVRNIIDEDICDLCGGDLKWPEHKPECEIGQVLAILAPAIRRATQEEGNGCAL